MASEYSEVQLTRFGETERLIGSHGSAVKRNGRIVSAGSKASTPSATYWNVELLTTQYAQFDINIGDRYGVAVPVYVVLRNVQAPAGLAFSEGDGVSLSLTSTSAPGGDTIDLSPGTHGYSYAEGSGATIISGSGGGGLGCYGSINIWETNFG